MAPPEMNVSLSDMFNDHINYKRGAIRDSISLLSNYSDKIVLDFGCGSAPSRDKLEATGARWIGIDNAGSEATIRCDGHQLPFQDHSFDVIIADVVFEHLLDPFQAMREIARVCKRGGYIVGYVAFLEPFHMSYFHHSHKGIEYLLQSNGFRVTDILPSRSGIEKLFEDMMFPRKIIYITAAVSRAVRCFLFVCKKLLCLIASVVLLFKREDFTIKKKKLNLYQIMLDLGYAGGILFMGIKE